MFWLGLCVGIIGTVLGLFLISALILSGDDHE